MVRHAAHHAHTLAFQRMFPNYREGQDTMKTLPSTTGLPKKMRGFTLIEIAIVLVIVGLLLGGVLKGQEFIENARVNRVASDINAITAAAFAYQDRYGSLPGSDSGATRFPSISEATFNGPGNGVLSGVADGTTGQASSGAASLFWLHLRASGLISGCAQTDGTPRTTDGCFAGPASPFGSAYAAWNGWCAAYNRGNHIRVTVPVRAGQQLDSRLDDGRPNSGSVTGHRAGSAANNFNSSGGSCYAAGVAGQDYDLNFPRSIMAFDL